MKYIISKRKLKGSMMLKPGWFHQSSNLPIQGLITIHNQGDENLYLKVKR